MKKYIKIELLLLIFVISITFNVYAVNTTAELTLTPSATEVKIGDIVTIMVSAKCATKVEGFDSILTWDKTKLELTNLESLGTNGFISVSENDESTGKFKLSVLYGGSGETPTEANFATLSFKVLDSATVKEKLAVTLSEIEVGDANDSWIAVQDKTIELTVIADVPPLEGENNPSKEEQKLTEEIKSTQKNDTTIADKPINNAGLRNYVLVITLGIVVTIVLYMKCRKYQDIK